MNTLWETTLNLVSYHTGGRVEIERHGGQWPTLVGSQTALGQVLSNVLINAVEAVQNIPGGRVWVTHRAEGDSLEVLIEDNGPGIPEDDRERVFDPFHTSGKAGGTGLGLAISRRIAREHGGDLSVDRSERGGARFRLRLSTPPAHRESGGAVPPGLQ